MTKFDCVLDEPLQVDDTGLDPLSWDYENELAQRYALLLSDALMEGRPLSVKMYDTKGKRTKTGKPYSKDVCHGETA